MAILKNGLLFTGGISGISAYTMKGSNRVVVRAKGGASKKKIQTSPAFKLTRKNNAEFGGCSKAAASIGNAIYPLKHLADYHFAPVLTSLSKHIQLLDENNNWGERSILFSQHRYLLEGFHLNRQTNFDNAIRHPLTYNIDRSIGLAVVQIPQLLQKINLHLPWKYPLYRFIITLGVVKDRTFESTRLYNNPDLRKQHPTQAVHTAWHSPKQPLAAQTIELQIPKAEKLKGDTSLVLAAGIEIGMPITDNFIQPATDAGCAKILALA
jgi:hypothetical protein